MVFHEAQHPDKIAAKAYTAFEDKKYRDAAVLFTEASLGYLRLVPPQPAESVVMGKETVKAANRLVEEALESNDFETALRTTQGIQQSILGLKATVRP